MLGPMVRNTVLLSHLLEDRSAQPLTRACVVLYYYFCHLPPNNKSPTRLPSQHNYLIQNKKYTSGELDSSCHGAKYRFAFTSPGRSTCATPTLPYLVSPAELPTHRRGFRIGQIVSTVNSRLLSALLQALSWGVIWHSDSSNNNCCKKYHFTQFAYTYTSYKALFILFSSVTWFCTSFLWVVGQEYFIHLGTVHDLLQDGSNGLGQSVSTADDTSEKTSAHACILRCFLKNCMDFSLKWNAHALGVYIKLVLYTFVRERYYINEDIMWILLQSFTYWP